MALSMLKMFHRGGGIRKGYVGGGISPRISVRFPVELYEQLDAEAKRLDVSFATVVRLACRDWFAN